MVNWRMSYVARSKILEEMIIELRKKGLSIPPNVLSDLKSARTLMQVMSASKRDVGEAAPQIDVYLSSAEANLVTEAGKLLPPEKVEDYIKKLELASCDSCVTVVPAKEESRFMAGVPRAQDQKWVRVQPIASLPLEKLKLMATEANVQFREDNDGHLIVSGNQDDVKKFVKKMTAQAGPTSK
jgi:hypothetical protein